jgi:hypothetical protein
MRAFRESKKGTLSVAEPQVRKRRMPLIILVTGSAEAGDVPRHRAGAGRGGGAALNAN